jgi:hypothetical protein
MVSLGSEIIQMKRSPKFPELRFGAFPGFNEFKISSMWPISGLILGTAL